VSAWTGISADQHDVHSHAAVTGFVTGGQAAITSITPSNLPSIGSITLLTDVAGVLTTQQAATESRLDAAESKINEIIGSLRAAGQIVT
jgi:hypothetical protein